MPTYQFQIFLYKPFVSSISLLVFFVFIVVKNVSAS